MTELFGLEAYAPAQIAARVRDVGVAKARLGLTTLALLSLLAGPRAARSTRIPTSASTRANTISTKGKGAGCITVVMVMGTMASSSMRWNILRLPMRSLNRPTQRAVNKVTVPPHK